MVFQHVTGGSLIAAARNATLDGRDTMRYADLDENQRLLVEGFSLARDPGAELIIMDGHVVIDSGEGLTKISSDVFRALDVKAIVHLEADSPRLAQNRSRDTFRSRPRYDSDILKMHQDISRSHARSIASNLRIDFYIVEHHDVSTLAKKLEGER